LKTAAVVSYNWILTQLLITQVKHCCHFARVLQLLGFLTVIMNEKI